MVNGETKLSIYDRDIKGRNSRYAMISQAMIQHLAEGDEVWAHLHRGALKGGSTTFTRNGIWTLTILLKTRIRCFCASKIIGNLMKEKLKIAFSFQLSGDSTRPRQPGHR